MSNLSIHALVSKKTATMNRLNIVAQNVANNNSSGYKKDKVIFDSYIHYPKNIDLKKTYLVHDIVSYTDFRDGSIKVTDNPLDLAINGKVFFTIMSGDNKFYSKAGKFYINHNSELVTSDGSFVLSDNNNKIIIPKDASNIKINNQGEIYVENQHIADIALVSFSNLSELNKVGNNLFETTQDPLQPENYNIIQGALEHSNTEPVEEISELVEIKNDYAKLQKLINREYQIYKDTMKIFSKNE